MKEKDKIIFAKLLLKITFIMIIVSVGLKLLGFNFFEADHSNKILLYISNFIDNYGGKDYIIKGVFNTLLLLIQTFIIFRLACKNNNMKVYYLTTILTTVISITSQILITDYLPIKNEQLASFVYGIFSFLVIIIPSVIIDIRIKSQIKIQKPIIIRAFIKIWNRVKKPVAIFFIITAYQIIVLFLRNLAPVGRYDTLYNFLLNFDYIILLITTYYIFIKRENKLKFKSDFDFALTKMLNQRPSMEELKYKVEGIKNGFVEFKAKEKIDKIVFILYIIFFIIQEMLTLGIIIYIATLNHYLIECLFILTAFIISKKVFGAFHFKSFILCFFVSNVSFFVLSKITMNVTFTFVVPVLCGILLSYVASRFIKKTDIEPYRGMPKEDLSKICKTKELNKVETGILIDYYCNRFNLDKIAFKYHYSDRNIQRIKATALQKLEV